MSSRIGRGAATVWPLGAGWRVRARSAQKQRVVSCAGSVAPCLTLRSGAPEGAAGEDSIGPPSELGYNRESVPLSYLSA
jgi:hypothetical protein